MSPRFQRLRPRPVLSRHGQRDHRRLRQRDVRLHQQHRQLRRPSTSPRLRRQPTATPANSAPTVLASNVPAPSAQFGAAVRRGAPTDLFSTSRSRPISATTSRPRRNLAGNPIPWVNLTNFTAASSLAHVHRPHRHQFPHPLLPRHVAVNQVGRVTPCAPDLQGGAAAPPVFFPCPRSGDTTIFPAAVPP